MHYIFLRWLLDQEVKMTYMLAFFPSELKKEQDIYTEFVSMDYEYRGS